MKLAVALTIVLLVGCATRMPPPSARATLPPIQVRCAHAGNSGVRIWACTTRRERAEFVGALFYPLPKPQGWPVHFAIVRDHHPQWAEIIDLKTKLRGTVRFEDTNVQPAGDDLGVHTAPLVKNGRTIAYLTWCMDGEFDSYQGPLASPQAAMTTCRAFWKRTSSDVDRGSSKGTP